MAKRNFESDVARVSTENGALGPKIGFHRGNR
jgi:hypothetical protein